VAWLIGVLFLLNVAATIAVWRTPLYEPSQRVRQTLIVWVLPAVGALLILVVWWSAREDSSRHRTIREALNIDPDHFSQKSAVDGDWRPVTVVEGPCYIFRKVDIRRHYLLFPDA
jgi:cyanate permease